METIAGIILVLLTFGLFAVWTVMTKYPRHWQRAYWPRTWLSAMKWTIILTVAGIVGSQLSSGKGEISSDVLAGGLVLLILEAVLWTQAKTWGPRKDD